jgi:hypothetical protein
MLPETMRPVFSNVKPMVPKAKRQYYHSRSRLPLNPEHLDVDSDEESEDEWMDIHAQAVSRKNMTHSYIRCLQLLTPYSNTLFRA